MKRFDLIKTVQLLLLVVLAIAALVFVLRDKELYALMAVNGHIRLLGFILWAVLGISFGFLFYDFHSYSDLKRENLELDHAVYSDALTGIANRYSVDVYIGRYLGKALPERMGCVTIELTNLSEINRKQGHAGGDAVIQDFSEILQQASASGGECFIGRNGGNKFVAIFKECAVQDLDSFTKQIDLLLAHRNEKTPELMLSCRYGIAHASQLNNEAAGTANEAKASGAAALSSLPELIGLSDRLCRSAG